MIRKSLITIIAFSTIVNIQKAISLPIGKIYYENQFSEIDNFYLKDLVEAWQSKTKEEKLKSYKLLAISYMKCYFNFDEDYVNNRLFNLKTKEGRENLSTFIDGLRNYFYITYPQEDFRTFFFLLKALPVEKSEGSLVSCKEDRELKYVIKKKLFDLELLKGDTNSRVGKIRLIDRNPKKMVRIPIETSFYIELVNNLNKLKENKGIAQFKTFNINNINIENITSNETSSSNPSSF